MTFAPPIAEGNGGCKIIESRKERRGRNAYHSEFHGPRPDQGASYTEQKKIPAFLKRPGQRWRWYRPRVLGSGHVQSFTPDNCSGRSALERAMRFLKASGRRAI